jgi:hypothetical protein
MVSSVILAIAALLFSENQCAYDASIQNSWLGRIELCLQLFLFEGRPGTAFDEPIYLSVKYPILAAAVGFGVGLLWHRGAVPLPPTKAGNSETPVQRRSGDA